MYFQAPKSSSVEEKMKFYALSELYHILGMSACEDEMDCEMITLVIPTFGSYYDYLVTGDYLEVSFYSRTVELCHDFAERFFDLVTMFNDGTDSNITIEILD